MRAMYYTRGPRVTTSVVRQLRGVLAMRYAVACKS